jgi:chromatin modification-related protein VID21
MRLDYAEERRWKRMLAREFAYQVVEWHLSSPEDKAALMVGSRGWSSPQSIDSAESTSRPAHGDDIEMDTTAGETEGDKGQMDDTSGEVLKELLPRRGRRGRKANLEAVNDEVAEQEQEEGDESEAKKADTPGPTTPHDDIDIATQDTSKQAPEPGQVAAAAEKTQEGEVDADGEMDAEGEIDALGEDDDGEGSADIVDGVIGLEDIPADGDVDADGEAEEDVEMETGVNASSESNALRSGVKLANGLVLSGHFTGPERANTGRCTHDWVYRPCQHRPATIDTRQPDQPIFRRLVP